MKKLVCVGIVLIMERAWQILGNACVVLAVLADIEGNREIKHGSLKPRGGSVVRDGVEVVREKEAVGILMRGDTGRTEEAGVEGVFERFDEEEVEE